MFRDYRQQFIVQSASRVPSQQETVGMDPEEGRSKDQGSYHGKSAHQVQLSQKSSKSSHLCYGKLTYSTNVEFRVLLQVLLCSSLLLY